MKGLERQRCWKGKSVENAWENEGGDRENANEFRAETRRRERERVENTFTSWKRWSNSRSSPSKGRQVVKSRFFEDMGVFGSKVLSAAREGKVGNRSVSRLVDFQFERSGGSGAKPDGTLDPDGRPPEVS